MGWNHNILDSSFQMFLQSKCQNRNLIFFFTVDIACIETHITNSVQASKYCSVFSIMPSYKLCDTIIQNGIYNVGKTRFLMPKLNCGFVVNFAPYALAYNNCIS